MANLVPNNEAEIADFIASSLSAESPIELIGQGTKRKFGEPLAANNILDLSQLSGIISYQPEELVLTVKPSTLLSELQQALAEKRQILAFEPPDIGGLFAEDYKNNATIGGSVLCNLSGSRRPFAGAARDYFLGFSGVSGRGEIFKAGGKVVKNVTGFDLCKLIAGSYGTLVAVSELTLKVHPRSEFSQSWSVSVADMKEARGIMRESINKPFSPTGVAYLPSEGVILRFEGGAAALSSAQQQLRDLARSFTLIAEGEASQKLWEGISKAEIFNYQKNVADYLWRISLPPEASPEFVASIEIGENYFADWGGALIWLQGMTDRTDSIRKLCEKLGGYAHVIRCPQDDAVARLHPRPAAELKILKSLKKGFDPANILNPNRMGF